MAMLSALWQQNSLLTPRTPYRNYSIRVSGDLVHILILYGLSYCIEKTMVHRTGSAPPYPARKVGDRPLLFIQEPERRLLEPSWATKERNHFALGLMARNVFLRWMKVIIESKSFQYHNKRDLCQ